MALSTPTILLSGVARTARAAASTYAFTRAYTATVFGLAAAFAYRGSPQDAYNMLWGVVFGFATLNILSLAARGARPGRRGLSFGEFVAVLVVVLAIFLLGWEMLHIFHVFPIKLQR
jgi:hypothetical protein